MSKIAIAILFLSLPLAAQNKPENIISPNTRIYEPKYLKGERAGAVARFVSSILESSPPVMVRWEPGLNLMTISSQKPEKVDQAEALVRRFDVPEAAPPERPFALTVHLVRASSDPSKVQGQVPPELEAVVKEMKGSLPYGGFKLVDTINVNVRDGLRLEDALPMAASNNNLPHFYSLQFDGPMLSADGKVFTLGGFRFGVKIPVSTSNGVLYQEESIATPLAIQGDQKQVLGKITLSPATGDVLFIVLSRR